MLTTTNTIYNNLQALIRQTVLNYYHLHGGDLEEMFSVANLAFVEGCQSYDEGRSKITTWIHHCIDNRLKEESRQKAYSCRPHVHPRPDLVKGDYWYVDLLDELTEDGRTIIQLIFDTPKDLQTLITNECKQSFRVLGIFNKYLRQKYGWTHSRFSQATSKIHKALDD